MIVTITGYPGSGKSTVAKLLSQKFHVPFYSIGDLRGAMAKERGMTIDELNTLGEKEAFTDRDVDEYQKQLGETNQSLVLEGRTSWYFVPNSFKVFLEVDTTEGAKRVFEARQKSGREDESAYKTIEETKDALARRMASDQKRYQTHYGIDFLDRSHYDLILDTTHVSPEEIVEKISLELQKRETH